MSKIKLFADSTCDLPLSELKRMDIDIVPLIVTFGEDDYKDGIDINPRDLFKMVNEKKILPKTSAPSPIDFYNAFKPYIESGNTIIYVGLSSKISTTIQNAQMAADQFENDCVYVIDSLNLCAGAGGLIKNMYKLIEKGMEAHEVVKETKRILPNYKLFFTVETLDYIKMGGRCSSTSAIVGNLLNIKPIISMTVDGLEVWKKTRGKKKAINSMVEEVINDRDNILNGEIHLACAYGNEKEKEELKKLLMEHANITNFHEYNIGCVISSHCGEGTVGFGYFLKN